MRIIGGQNRGRKLYRVGKKTTRETADMVKEAVFNMLGGTLDGIVLDLFAGSGAYGLEALSRGATKAYFVDIDKDAIKTIYKNVESLKLNDHVHIIHSSYDQYLKRMDNSILFDYVFIDPPYNMHIYIDLLRSLERFISPHGLIIIETDKNQTLPEIIGEVTKIKDKQYGMKRISIYQKTVII